MHPVGLRRYIYENDLPNLRMSTLTAMADCCSKCTPINYISLCDLHWIMGHCQTRTQKPWQCSRTCPLLQLRTPHYHVTNPRQTCWGHGNPAVASTSLQPVSEEATPDQFGPQETHLLLQLQDKYRQEPTFQTQNYELINTVVLSH